MTTQDGPLDTAHERWDEWWAQAKQRAHWRDPESAVNELIPALRARGVHRVLDVGAGIGRHSLAYSRAGFTVVATDASTTGLDEIRRSADAEELSIETHVAPFTALPLAEDSVDHVLAWNVLYHGDREIVRAALGECRRVLRDGGSFQLTMLSKRHRAFGVGRKVRPDTFVDDRSTGDKDHPHFYVDAPELTTLLADAGFVVESFTDVDQQPPGGFHWVVLCQASLDSPEPSGNT
jgi:SAM-dependent methyltransferase